MGEVEWQVWMEENKIMDTTIKLCWNYIKECVESDPECFYPVIKKFDEKFLNAALKRISVKETTDFVENYQYASLILDVSYNNEPLVEYRCFYKIDTGEYIDDYLKELSEI